MCVPQQPVYAYSERCPLKGNETEEASIGRNELQYYSHSSFSMDCRHAC